MNSKLFQYNEAINDCTIALLINSRYLKPIILRGNCYYELRMYQSAINDYHLALEIDENNACVKNSLDNTKQLLDRWLNDDYFVLGVNKGASKQEIDIAYRALSKIAFRDCHFYSPDEVKNYHQEIAQRLSQAKHNIQSEWEMDVQI